MDHEKGNTLKVYIKQYLNRYKGCYALVAGIMIFYISRFTSVAYPQQISGILRDWKLFFLWCPLYFAGYGTGIACGQ